MVILSWGGSGSHGRSVVIVVTIHGSDSVERDNIIKKIYIIVLSFIKWLYLNQPLSLKGKKISCVYGSNGKINTDHQNDEKQTEIEDNNNKRKYKSVWMCICVVYLIASLHCLLLKNKTCILLFCHVKTD